MNSKASNNGSEVDGEWANISSDPVLLYGSSRLIPNGGNAGNANNNTNANGQQSSSGSAAIANDNSDQTAKASDVITVFVKITMEGSADFPEISVAHKFESIHENEQPRNISVADLLHALPEIIQEYFADGDDPISVDHLKLTVYTYTKEFPNEPVTVSRKATLINGGKYFIKMFHNKQQRGIGNQFDGSSSATLCSSRLSMCSSMPSESPAGYEPYQQQNQMTMLMNRQFYLESAMKEIKGHLKKNKQTKQNEMAEHCNLESRIQELETKTGQLADLDTNEQSLGQNIKTEYAEKLENMQKIINKLQEQISNMRSTQNNESLDSIVSGFINQIEQSQKQKENLDFIRSMASNCQKWELDIVGQPVNEYGWEKLLKAIPTSGAECASIRVRAAKLARKYQHNFASLILSMADASDNSAMVKHLEFELDGMTPPPPSELSFYGAKWSGRRAVLHSNLSGYTAEMVHEEGKLLSFKLIHRSCPCQTQNFPLFYHSWFNLDEFLIGLSGGKRCLKLNQLPPELENCAQLFNICATKGAIFDIIDLPLEATLARELFIKLYAFWEKSSATTNCIRHIVFRVPNLKWDSTTMSMPTTTEFRQNAHFHQQRALSTNSFASLPPAGIPLLAGSIPEAAQSIVLHRVESNDCPKIVYRINNPALANECFALKMQSSANGTIVECSKINVASATAKPFDKSGTLTANTMTAAWLTFLNSSSTMEVNFTDPFDNIIAHMQQRPELVPEQFNLHFVNCKILLSASLLELLEEISDAQCAFQNDKSRFCCGHWESDDFAQCTHGYYQNRLCCGDHNRSNPSTCVQANNKIYCCKGKHQIRRHNHKHYILRTKYGNDSKIQLQMCIYESDGKSMISGFGAKKSNI